MGVLNKISYESQGIIPSSLDFIFRFFEEQQSQPENEMSLLDWKVHISFYQIYQEQIQDLFNPQNKNLQVREEFGEVFVEDLVEVPVKNLQ
jgi:kinesin family member 15